MLFHPNDNISHLFIYFFFFFLCSLQSQTLYCVCFENVWHLSIASRFVGETKFLLFVLINGALDSVISAAVYTLAIFQTNLNREWLTTIWGCFVVCTDYINWPTYWDRKHTYEFWVQIYIWIYMDVGHYGLTISPLAKNMR